MPHCHAAATLLLPARSVVQLHSGQGGWLFSPPTLRERTSRCHGTAVLKVSREDWDAYWDHRPLTAGRLLSHTEAKSTPRIPAWCWSLSVLRVQGQGVT
jgi:hypothetical protein